MGTSQPSVSLGDKWVPVNPMGTSQPRVTPSVSLGDKWVPVNPVCLWVTNGYQSTQSDKLVPVNPVCLWVTNGYQSTQCVFG